MFEVLIGSSAVRRVSGGRSLVVAALHGIVIVAATRATHAPPPPPPPPRVDTMVFVLDPAPIPITVASSADPGGVVDVPVDLPPVPLTAPTGIPPVQLGPTLVPARPWDRSSSPAAPVAGPARRESGPWLEAEVDQPAVPIRQPSPRYPPILREAGIEGRVELEFVIDTSGRVEEASLRVVSHSADGFDAAAIESISRSLFAPARVKGQVVRQRARQAIAFRIRTP